MSFTTETKKSVVLLSAFLFFFIAPLVADAGFGVSPGTIEETSLVPGSVFKRTIYLVQGDPKEDVVVRVAVESRDIVSWLSFPGGTEFTIPAGVQQFPLEMTVAVPENVAMGDYTAFVRVTTIPKTDPTQQITIALGGRVDVHLVVGDDVIVDFDVSGIDILDVKESEDPQVRLTINNNGNVPAGPERVSFDLYNKYGDVRLGYAEITEIERVDAFSRGEVDVSFPIDIRLARGEYWGHVRVYTPDGVIKETKTVFDVLPKTFLEKYLGVLIGTAVLLCLAAVVLFFIRRRRRVVAY